MAGYGLRVDREKAPAFRFCLTDPICVFRQKERADWKAEGEPEVYNSLWEGLQASGAKG